LRSRRIPRRKNAKKRRKYLNREEKNIERIKAQLNPEKRTKKRNELGEYPICPTRIPPMKKSRTGIKGRENISGCNDLGH
jgi:hypothetical protein